MGYTLKIGEAIVDWDWSYEQSPLDVTVRDEELPEAPAFDEYNPHKNACWPSYSQWARFSKAVGLERLFFGTAGDSRRDVDYEDTEVAGLLRPHSGCRPLLPEHLEDVRDALAAYRRAHPTSIPGWDPALDERGNVKEGMTRNDRYDGDLARLMWLEWWIDWALRTCDMPAFYNR